MSAQDQTSYLYGSNSVFIEELFEQYKENPGSVDASWQEFPEDTLAVLERHQPIQFFKLQ